MKEASMIAGGVLAAVLVISGLAGLNNLDAGEVGVMVKQFGDDRGIQDDNLGGGGGGTFWVNPITYDVFVYDTKLKQHPIDRIKGETQDGQPVAMDISFEIGLLPSAVPMLHATVGRNWLDEVVLPSARKAIRGCSSGQKSSDIYTSVGRLAVSACIDSVLQPKLTPMGIMLETNFRDLQFLNPEYVEVLETKSIAGEQEEIQTRYALAAIQEAIKVANIAEGQKQKKIKEAEAKREEMRLEGEGLRLKKEEEAKGILAVKTAEAEGQRLLVSAYGEMGAEAIVGIAWAENLGPNVKVYGVPTGAPGTTSIVDINGVLQGAFGGK